MSKRKIVLLASCALLLCIYIVQLALASKGGGKVIALDDKKQIDKIELSKATGEYSLSKEGDGWVVSDAKYPAAAASVDTMLLAIKSIKVLEKVGKMTSAVLERYELDGDKAITVKAFGNGELLRTIVIGKNAATSSQTYAVIDGGHDVCLVSGALHDTFDKTVDALRSRLIYSLDETSLKKVSVTYDGDTLAFEKAADSPEWTSADGTIFDSDKVSAWASSLYSVSAAKWLDDDAVLPDAPIVSARIECEGDFATLEIYKEGGKGEDAQAKYYCTSSATPYKAELSSYAAQKYMKKAADFAKD